MKKENLLIAVIIFIIIVMTFIDEETKHHYPFLVSLSASCVGGIIVGLMMQEC